jgi:hypothetical protein
MRCVPLVVVTGALAATLGCHGTGSQATMGAGGSGAAGSGSSSGTTASTTGTGTGGGSASTTTGSGGSGPAPIAGLRLFFTDLVSGPNSGGQAGKGAFVTVYGNGFGDAQGASTVTVGGGAADNYPVWTNGRITFQLGAAAQTGDVVVHVSGKGDSNALPFTVRAGNIYFVSASGKDGQDGSYASPWATIVHAKTSLMPGDIAYLGAHAGDSVSQTTVENYNAALSMDANDASNSGTADAPKALVVYPGATATVGAETGIERALLTPAISGTFDFWVIAGLTLRGESMGIDLENAPDGWRIVGNDIACPNGSGLTGCVNGGPTHLKFFGNVVHDAAANIPDAMISKYYHGVYWGSSHIEMGWNVVRDGKTCRAIQFHDTGGPNEFDLSVHDNLIHGTVCDGINFATVDPSQGTVEAYNNVVYDVGRGPDPMEASSDYAGVYVAGETDSGPAGSGTVEVYDNTFYDCGSWTQSSSAGAFNNGGGNPQLTMRVRDNLVYALSGESYVAAGAAPGLVVGSNNLFFGGSGVPAGVTATVTGDPLLVAPAMFDFHLQAGSPAIGAGVATPATTDFDGNPRPQGAPPDIGAYQHVE